MLIYKIIQIINIDNNTNNNNNNFDFCKHMLTGENMQQSIPTSSTSQRELGALPSTFPRRAGRLVS